MMTVNEVSKIAGVSVRTLQYYDEIGLLKPTGYTVSGYRLYDDAVLEVLQQILLFRELEFSLKEIKQIIENPDFDRMKALEQQISLLTLKKEHLDQLINYAKGLKILGEKNIDFSVFDTTQIKEYAKKAKEQWGSSKEYKEFAQKAEGITNEEHKRFGTEVMAIFAEFGKIKHEDPSSKNATDLVIQLQDYISTHFYKCSNEILMQLGDMYIDSGLFQRNIEIAGGEGTAAFVARAIKEYVMEDK